MCYTMGRARYPLHAFGVKGCRVAGIGYFRPPFFRKGLNEGEAA